MNETKIVLFGLNADPPHLGHLKVVHEVEKIVGQEATFIVMPTGDHPFSKKQHVAADHRLMMTKLLFQGLKQVIVDDYEIKKTSTSYTLDTLIRLKSRYPQSPLYFIMASDTANSFFLWHKANEILKLAIPIIVSRPQYELDKNVLDELYKLCHPLIITINSLDISSSKIREDLNKGKGSLDLSKEVLNYIHSHHLYRSNS